ncbi:MAG: aquaporin family protein [Proteobacteria bacterium]|nr:aquaporin family protein [Desulfobulbaceae bacterium]MBU4152811.1 aquaporin family protein [Pseudomonadota bacterium]MDP2106972.1 MIP/aquaporin family protein [Desulfobulbaceae bacterium]
MRWHDVAGEAIGTFILVFFGCGSVAVTVLFSAHVGLFQVAAIWGTAVTLAIYATRHLSCAHLNPAVSLAMVLGRRMSPCKLPAYVGAQFFGAFLAAGLIYLLFGASITAYEIAHGIVRGTSSSIQTAMIFGEFFPNPGVAAVVSVSTLNAFAAEVTGTFILVFLIFALTDGCNVGRPDDTLGPLFIGLTVMALICIIAPLTQAGFNPARDLAPRIFAAIAGWGRAAFPSPDHAFLTVYVAGPCLGGSLAALVFTKLLQPVLERKTGDDCGCNCNNGKEPKEVGE